MKKLFLMLSLIVFIFRGFSQNENNVPATISEDRELLKAEIPASINGSNLDPAAISSINATFTDSKISAKLGIPFKKIDDYNDLTWTFFVSGYVKATNGIGTLWSAESKPSEFGVSGGVSYMLAHRIWNGVDGYGNITTPRTSESYYWVNVRGGMDWAKFNIFNPVDGYELVNHEFKDNFGTGYIAINHYYGSIWNGWNKFLQHLASIGVGYAETNNYSTLTSRTLEEGALIYNPDGTAYKTVVKTTSGRIGDYKANKGMTAFFELFWPIVKRDWGTIYLGNRYTYYGIGKSNHVSNGSSGLYFNVKDSTRKDIVNFSVVAQFKYLNESSNPNYLDKNFSILLQASLPLSF